MDEEEALRQQEQLAKGKFDLDDFRKQIGTMKKMGSMRDLMSKIPGMDQMGMENLDGIDADEEVKRIQGIIDSMTPAERRDPSLIDISRRRRIAAGSGVDPADVSGLVKQFDAMAAVVKQMAQMSMMDKVRTLTGLGRVAATNPAAQIMAPKIGTGKRLTRKETRETQKAAREGRTPPPPRGTRPAGAKSISDLLTTDSLPVVAARGTRL